MHNLKLQPAKSVGSTVIHACSASLTPDSPATSAMTDFLHLQPRIVESTMPAILAERLMLHEHDKLRLVLDRDQRFVGVVTLADVGEQRIMQRVTTGFERNEVLVKHVMQARTSLMALRLSDLQTRSVAELAETLKKDGAKHCLVIDGDDNHVRGIISAEDLAARLNLKFHESKPSSLAAFVQELHS